MAKRLILIVDSESDDEADYIQDFFDGIRHFATYMIEGKNSGKGINYSYKILDSKSAVRPMPMTYIEEQG